VTGREMPTPISASSLTDSRIVTSCSGFATLVEMAAAKPARPAPMMMRWIDMLAELRAQLARQRPRGIEMRSFTVLNTACSQNPTPLLSSIHDVPVLVPRKSLCLPFHNSAGSSAVPPHTLHSFNPSRPSERKNKQERTRNQNRKI